MLQVIHNRGVPLAELITESETLCFPPEGTFGSSACLRVVFNVRVVGGHGRRKYPQQCRKVGELDVRCSSCRREVHTWPAYTRTVRAADRLCRYRAHFEES